MLSPEMEGGMERLVEGFGMESVSWEEPLAGECLGWSAFTGGRGFCDLLRESFAALEESGAQFILVGCPFCQAGLDLWQQEVGRLRRRALDMPVVYISELVGYALELGVMEWCSARHVTTIDHLVLEAGVAEMSAEPEEK